MRRSRSLARLGLEVPPLPPGAPGDPGLFGPGSEVWRVGREKALLAGGPAALLLQLAHPLVAAGVAAHSDFRADPLQRLRATLQVTLTITFGDSIQAREAAARVAATHRRVKGVLPDDVGAFRAGTPYRASDPELAMWVYATLVFTALEAFSRFVRPLGEAERARYYQEGKRFAFSFGVTEEVMPPDYPAFRTYLAGVIDGPTLAIGPHAADLARDILAPGLTGALRALGPLARPLTAAILPPRLRRAYGLAWGGARQRAFLAFQGAARASIRVLPPSVRYWPHYRVAERRMALGRERTVPFKR
jgi:uncharacterized protein (DUF2236 family)